MTSLEMILRVRFVTKQLFCNFFSEHNLTVEWDLICLIRLKNWLHIQVNFLMFILHIISFSFLNHENVKKIHKVNKTYTIKALTSTTSNKYFCGIQTNQYFGTLDCCLKYLNSMKCDHSIFNSRKISNE